MPFVTAGMVAALVAAASGVGRAARRLRLRGGPGAADALRPRALPGARRGGRRGLQQAGHRAARGRGRARGVAGRRPRRSRPPRRLRARRCAAADPKNPNAPRPPDPGGGPRPARRALRPRDRRAAAAGLARLSRATRRSSPRAANSTAGSAAAARSRPSCARRCARSPTGSRASSPSRRIRGGTSGPASYVYPMTCHSGGSVDIYVEPVLPRPRDSWSSVCRPSRAPSRASRRRWATPSTPPIPRRTAAAFPEADRLWTDLGVDRAAARRAPARGRRDDGGARRGGGRSRARRGAGVSRRRRERASASREMRETLAARGVSIRGARAHQESGGARHRRADSRGDRGLDPGRDRSGAAPRGAARRPRCRRTRICRGAGARRATRSAG